MSSSSAMAGGVLALVLWCVLVPVARAGNCWIIGKKGRCTDLLETGVTRAACCARSRVSTAWSSQDLGQGDLFYWRALGGGVHCRPCKATCAKVKCPRGQRCRRRGGVPRCVCAPKCRPARAGRSPVCGSDGRTYRNICKLKRRQCRKKNGLTMAYKGVCQASCDTITCANEGDQCVLDQNRMPHCVRCLRQCSGRSSNPVCGVDGVTYSSRCHARQAACLLGRAIPTAYRGPCRPGVTCSSLRCNAGQRCLLNADGSRPRCTSCDLRCRRRGGAKQLRVCGSNHVTYRSWCHMMKDACATGLVIDVLHAGACFPRRYSSGAGDGRNETAPFADFPFLLRQRVD